jgi:uncharacterized protein YecE (DUF72 family)
VVVRVGTSGWAYPEWRGEYYPPGTRQQLEYLADRLSTVEVNGSFYRLQRPETYRSWYQRTPVDFVFAVKGHRYLTHRRRLREPIEPMANFLASGVLELGTKLGPLLWQLPANLAFDAFVVRDFLAALPTAAPSGRPLRHAVEPRHQSFRDPLFADLLREHGVALVAADTAGKFPYFAEQTADFGYVRLHGDTELYVSAYGDAALATWADRIRALAEQGDVYVYFDNTAKSAAPRDAERLVALLRR